MRRFRMSVSIVGVVIGLAAATASAQDWLVSPPPAIPLHVPIAPPAAGSQPPIAESGGITPSSAPGSGATHAIGPARGGTPPAASLPPLPPLPSFPLTPLAWNGAPRTTAPPVIAFPQIPITWLFGF